MIGCVHKTLMQQTQVSGKQKKTYLIIYVDIITALAYSISHFKLLWLHMESCGFSRIA